MDKPNCYECKHRGSIPGSAHSCCRHPSTSIGSNVFGNLMEFLSGAYLKAANQLDISGARRGIESGWFNWPADFDPTWLNSCNGFEQKESK